MITRNFFLFAFLFQASLTQATHLKAGYITVEYVSDLTYKATVTLYTRSFDLLIPTDTISLDWGDGTYETLIRSNGPLGSNGIPQGVELENDIRYSVYESSLHVYPGECRYNVFSFHPNRISNVINMNNGASVNIPMYIETSIIAEIGNPCGNSSPFMLSHPVMFANVNDSFSFNPVFIESDGDSLHFELIPPMMGQDASVPDYRYPDEITPGANNHFSINPLSGEIAWFTPQRMGMYSIAVRISEYKNGLLYATSVFDCLIIVENQPAPQLSFNTVWQADSNGNYVFTVNPGDTLQLDFSVTADSIIAIGEPMLNASTSAFEISGTSPSLSGSFSWVPDAAHSRTTPYIMTFRASYPHNSINYERDLTALIYVSGGSQTSCPAPATGCPLTGISRMPRSNVTVFPNPFSSVCRIVVSDHLAGNGDFTLRLFDAAGKVITTLQSPDGQFLLDSARLDAGLYYYEISNNHFSMRAAGKVIVSGK